MITLYREDYRPTPPYSRMRIEGAEPREVMAASLMYEIVRCENPWAHLTGEPVRLLGGTILLPGDVLHVRDDFGHAYIYRVVGYDFQRDVFELEWPD